MPECACEHISQGLDGVKRVGYAADGTNLFLDVVSLRSNTSNVHPRSLPISNLSRYTSDVSAG